MGLNFRDERLRLASDHWSGPLEQHLEIWHMGDSRVMTKNMWLNVNNCKCGSFKPVPNASVCPGTVLKNSYAASD